MHNNYSMYDYEMFLENFPEIIYKEKQEIDYKGGKS